MLKKINYKKTLGVSVVLVSLLGLTACSSTPSETQETPKPTKTVEVPADVNDYSSDVSTQTEDAYIVGPIFGTPSELLVAQYVKVPAGSQLFLAQVDSGEYSVWTATSSNEQVAVFVPGVNGTPEDMTGQAPLFNVLSIGKSDIVLSNTSTGEKINFVIEGIPVG